MKKKLIIGVALVIFLISLFNFYTNHQKVEKLKTQINNLNQEINKAEKKNEELNEKLINVQSDEFIEKAARTKLGLVKPGEVLVIPVEEKDSEKDK
ncbi:MAG TPA: septum formation initiator family protein [Halanaerobiales bacterium]|nr:septum formation initiator family protein [Halanaerobiales bacterium]